MFENLNFGKTGFQTSVFEKYFLSYSCISSIKFNALRSFCNFLLYFSRNFFFFFFFLNFDRSKVFFDWSKLQLKVLAWLCVFRSIEPIFRSIESHIESFLKTEFLTCSSLFKLFFKTLSLYSIGPRVQTRFLSFSTKIIQGFLSSKAGKTFIPLLFFYF